MKPKSCPFCGKDYNVHIDNDHDDFFDGFGHQYFVICDYCQARGPIMYTEEKAVMRWMQGYRYNWNKRDVS